MKSLKFLTNEPEVFSPLPGVFDFEMSVFSIVKLDEAIDAVESPTHLIMTKAMRRIITAAARTSTVGIS